MARYGPTRALLVVDVQNDFADPAGALYVPGGTEVVPEIRRQIAAARAAGAVVVYTQDWHPPSTPHFAKDGGIWPVHCVAGTWGAELVPGLPVDGPVVRKGADGSDGYSGFSNRDPVTGERSSTGLAEILAEAGVEQVTVVGLATDYCVKETALDALGEGLRTVVLLPAVRAVEVTAGDGERALAELAAAGVELVDR